MYNIFKDTPYIVLNAIAVTSVTLVGNIHTEYPLPSGNCFSVQVGNGKHYRIVNFNHENLEELIRREVISFPIKIMVLSDRVAVIHDSRIDHDWYDTRFCEVCCPNSLLPLPQLLCWDRDERDGTRTTTEYENGSVIVEQKIKSSKRKLEGTWTIDVADYIPIVEQKAGITMETEFSRILSGKDNE